MRRTTSLMIAAAMLAAPAYAQDNIAGGNTSAADAGTLTNTDAALTTDATTNGLTAGPGAAPVTTDTAMAPYGEAAAANEDDDDRLPWGLLGLLGLVGLLGRRSREDTDRNRTTG